MTIKQVLDENIRAAAGALARLSAVAPITAAEIFPERGKQASGFAEFSEMRPEREYPGDFYQPAVYESRLPESYPRSEQAGRENSAGFASAAFEKNPPPFYGISRETAADESDPDIERISELIEKDSLRYSRRF